MSGPANEAAGDAERRPVLTLDLDGVVCAPILGQNIGIHRGFLDVSAAPRRAGVWPRWLAEPWDRLRYELRRPLPDTATALERLSGLRRLVLLTGRRSHPARWLRRHSLDQYFHRLLINEGALRSPHYKLRAIESLGAHEHVEDDPRTAQLLAETGITVYLRDWPRNRDLAFHAGVRRIRDLHELADILSSDART